MAYVIDTYDKFNQFDRESTQYKTLVNGQWYAIKYVPIVNGLPQLQTSIGYEIDPNVYHIYDTYEAALNFLTRMKTIN